MARRKVIIMGAGGRDFHNFNVVFRNNPEYEVVAFTASQIPNIDNRVYPPELAGPNYPNGIPILSEERLEELVRKYGVHEVVLAYSDLLDSDVMAKLYRVLISGADFRIIGPSATMLKSNKYVIAICASRTGAGKSTVARKVCRILRQMGKRYVVVRHPMVYSKEFVACQRFSSLDDLDKYGCTIEEREEYEWHIREGSVVYAGVDYAEILKEAEKEADVIVWDGGNNDWPFYKPDLYITVVDPLRPGHELSSFPGVVNVALADVIVVNKVNAADEKSVNTVVNNVRRVNPRAEIVYAESRVAVDNPELIRGKRVLVVEDGPSVTHGHLSYGAGYVAATKYGAAEIVDPRPYAVGSLREVYAKYKHIGKVLPAMGYGKEQMMELQETINKADADVVVLGTPSDLSRFLSINKPVVRVTYELREVGGRSLEEILKERLR